MDEDLKQILDNARASGASASQLQGIVNSYNQKKKINGGGGVDVLEPPTKSSLNTLPENDYSTSNIFNPTTPKPTVEEAPQYVRGKPQAVVAKSGIPLFDEKITVGEGFDVEQYNKDFELKTGYTEFGDINAPLAFKPLDLGMNDKRRKQQEDKKFSTYYQEDKKIKDAEQKVYLGIIKPEELADLRNSPYTKKMADSILAEYVPEGVQYPNGEIFDAAVKNIRAKNIGNYANIITQEEQSQDMELSSLLNGASVERVSVGGGTGGAAPNVSTTKLPLIDFNNPENYAPLLALISNENAYLNDASGKRLDKQDVLEKLNNRLFVAQSKLPLSEEVASVESNIKNAATRFNMRSEKGSETRQELMVNKKTIDEVAADNFSKGLDIIKITDNGKYRNIIKALRERSEVAEPDFERIAQLGQNAKNMHLRLNAVKDPNLLDDETDINYLGTSYESQKAEAAGMIGEYAKSKGFTNDSNFSEKQILEWAKEVGVSKEIATDLAISEQLGFYDAIPKSGVVHTFLERGIVAPFQNAVGTVKGMFENNTDTYLRSNSYSKGFAQKVPDSEGQYDTQLESNKSWYNTAIEGAGQFLSQIFLTRGIGGGLVKGASALAGKNLSGAFLLNAPMSVIQRGEVVTGTLVSSFMQTYGSAYDEYLNETGDPATARVGAFISGSIDGLTEQFLIEADVAKNIVKNLNKTAIKELVDMAKKGVDPALLTKKLGSVVADFGKKSVASGLDVTLQEEFEEVSALVLKTGLKQILSPRTADRQNFNHELFETIKATGLQTLIPAIISGGAAGIGSRKNLTQTALNEAAINIDGTRKALDRLRVDGRLTDDDFNQAIKIVKTHRESIHNAPTVDAQNNEIPLDKKLEYAIQETSIKINKAKLDNPAIGKPIKNDLTNRIEQSEKIQELIYNPEANSNEENKPTEVIEIAPKENVPTEKTKGAAIILPESNKQNNEIIGIGSNNSEVKIESAVIEINGKTYEGKNHAEAILAAQADGQDISQVDRSGQGKFKLSDGTIIDRVEAKQRFGQDRSELLIPQDEAANQANKDYGVGGVSSKVEGDVIADSKGEPIEYHRGRLEGDNMSVLRHKGDNVHTGQYGVFFSPSKEQASVYGDVESGVIKAKKIFDFTEQLYKPRMEGDENVFVKAYEKDMQEQGIEFGSAHEYIYKNLYNELIKHGYDVAVVDAKNLDTKNWGSTYNELIVLQNPDKVFIKNNTQKENTQPVTKTEVKDKVVGSGVGEVERKAKAISKRVAVEHAGHEGAKRVTGANENTLELDGYGTVSTSQFINTLVENGRLSKDALKNRHIQLTDEYATKLLNENSDLFPKEKTETNKTETNLPTFESAKNEYDAVKEKYGKHLKKDGGLRANTPENVKKEIEDAYTKMQSTVKQERDKRVSDDKRDTGLIDGIERIKDNTSAFTLVRMAMNRGVIPDRQYNEFGKNLLHIIADAKDSHEVTMQTAEIIQDFSQRANVKVDDALARELQAAENLKYEPVEQSLPTQVVKDNTVQPNNETELPKEETPETKTEKPRSKLLDLADRIEKEGFLPDWLKADLPEGTQIQGFNFNKAVADAIRLVDAALNKGVDIAKAIEEGFNSIRQHYKDNNAKIKDEEKLKEQFEKFVNDNYSQEEKELTPKELAAQIKSGDLNYNDVIEGKDDAFIESVNDELFGKGKQSVSFDNEAFKSQVRKLKEVGQSREEIIEAMGAAKKLTKRQKELVAEVFGETAEQDKIAAELQEAFKSIAKGEKPKSVLKRLSVSSVTDLVDALKNALTYTAVSNDQLEAMADYIVDSIDLNKADQYINAIISNSKQDIKQLLRAKVIVALQKEGNNDLATRMIQDMADEATESGRQTQSLKRAYEILGAKGNPATRTTFMRRVVEMVQKKAASMTSHMTEVIGEKDAEIAKINEQLHKKAQASSLINQIKNVISDLCGLRNKK